MPIKKLTFRQRDQIFDIVDEGTMMEDDSDYSGIPDALNEVFARIYGYSGGTGSSRRRSRVRKPKRKLSDWQKYIKNKRNHIKFRDGKLNLKKMGVEFRKKKRR